MAQGCPTEAGIFKGVMGRAPLRQRTSEKAEQAVGGKGKCGMRKK